MVMYLNHLFDVDVDDDNDDNNDDDDDDKMMMMTLSNIFLAILFGDGYGHFLFFFSNFIE